MVKTMPSTISIFGFVFGVLVVIFHCVSTPKIIVEFLKLIYMGKIVGSGIEAAATLGSAAIDAAAQTTVGTLNYKAQKDYNEKYLQGVEATNQTNIDLAHQQNEWNKQQWERENAYNDPSAQVQRLRGAGLSAAAAAQSIEGAGNASSLQSADLSVAGAPQPMQAPQLELSGMGLIGLARSLADLKKANAEADKAQTESNLWNDVILTENDARRWSTEMTKENLRQSQKRFPYSMNALKYEVENYRLQNQQTRWAIKQAKENYKLTKQSFNFLESMNEETLNKIRAEIENVKKQGKVIDNTAENLASSTAVNYEQAQNLQEQRENIKEERKGLQQENKAKELQNILTKYGCPETTSQRIGAMISSGQIDIDEVFDSLEQIKWYLSSGGRLFRGSSMTRDFLNNVINEGTSRGYKTPVWSHGTLQKGAELFGDYLFNLGH